MPRLHILVEGCLDAALAQWLTEETGLHGEVELAGGWPGVIRQAAELTINTGSLIIGFIDADNDLETRIKEAAKQLERYLRRKGYRGQIKQLHEQPYPPVLELTIETGEETKTGYIIAWCTGTPCRGTAENILTQMLEERYNYARASPPGACSNCPNTRCTRDYTKYEPIIFLAACSGREGTPILVPAEQHCGIDVKQALKQLNLAETSTAKSYKQALRNIAQRRTRN